MAGQTEHRRRFTQPRTSGRRPYARKILRGPVAPHHSLRGAVHRSGRASSDFMRDRRSGTRRPRMPPPILFLDNDAFVIEPATKLRARGKRRCGPMSLIFLNNSCRYFLDFHVVMTQLPLLYRKWGF